MLCQRPLPLYHLCHLSQLLLLTGGQAKKSSTFTPHRVAPPRALTSLPAGLFQMTSALSAAPGPGRTPHTARHVHTQAVT